jgi:hypothetical protein
VTRWPYFCILNQSILSGNQYSQEHRNAFLMRIYLSLAGTRSLLRLGVYWTRPNQPKYWIIQYHNGLGGWKWKDECCSPESVAFHYILPRLMYHLERQLYYCRDDHAPNLATYNARHNLSISDQILIFQELEVDFGPLPIYRE